MPTPEQQALAVVLLALFGPKLVTWAAARFVSKKDEAEKKVDEAEKKAKHEKEEREKEDARKRDEREAAMSMKLDAIASTLADLKADAREDRQRAEQMRGAVDKIEERINAVSNNHRPRIEALEQKVAVLEAAASKKR